VGTVTEEEQALGALVIWQYGRALCSAPSTGEAARAVFGNSLVCNSKPPVQSDGPEGREIEQYLIPGSCPPPSGSRVHFQWR
jgi:hypothetical protein